MKNHKDTRGPGGLLDEALGGTSHVRILRYLCRAEGEHTGREIGRAVHISHPSVHRALRTLAKRGMVQAIRHGAAIAYRLNEDHWLIRTGIRPLFAAEAGFFTTLGEAVRHAAGIPVRSVVLFGSLARGEASADSDIDVLCLTTRATEAAAAEQNLAEAAAALRRQSGRRLSVLVLPVADFARRYRRRERLAREIVETGWAIAGESLSEVLR